MKRNYDKLDIKAVTVGFAAPVLLASGKEGATIDHIEAEVEGWNNAGTIDTPITSGSSAIEF